MKNIFLSIIATLIANAANANLYYGHIDYTNSIKKSANYIGLYGSYFKSPYKLEFDAEHLEQTYKNSTPTYKQSNLTLVGHYYRGYNWDFSAGINNIFINQKDNPNNYDNILFAGVKYYKTYQYNYGFNLYYSNYDYFKVWQLSPTAGFNFGNYKSKFGSFYLGGTMNLIHISKKGYANKENYLNFDFKLQNFHGPLTTTFFASLGKSAYKVANGGFSALNLKEEHKFSYGTEFNYNLKKLGSVSFKYSKNKFTDSGINAKSDNYIFSYAKHF